MIDFSKHLILTGTSLQLGLKKLNDLSKDAILFVVDKENKLIGSLTDGDIRRGLINELSINKTVDDFIQKEPKYIRKSKNTLNEIIHLRERDLKIVPVIDDNDIIIKVLNFRLNKSYLPLDVVIMAGGLGSRLKPLTDNKPKPLLVVGGKTIIEHNIDKLISYGVDDFYISIRYLGDQIESHINSTYNTDASINFIREDKPLGTIGAVSKIKNFNHDYVLITNSDILTNLNYEEFFLDFIAKGTDMSILTIPHKVDIPYAVLETTKNMVKSFKEKPKMTYYCNGGIYLLKTDVLKKIPQNKFYNATDLIEKILKSNSKVSSFPLRGYWLDIGNHEDYNKAQNDIQYLNDL